MAITDTNKSYYSYSTAKDIYKLLGTGDEFAKYQRVETGIAKPRVLSKGFATKDLFQDNIANPRVTDASGTVLIDGRILSVDEIMMLPSITPSDWKDNFPEFQPSGNSVDLKANPAIMNTVMDLLKTTVGEQISDLAYKGDTGTTGQLDFVDGYSKIMKADSDVVDVANVGVISVTNVLSIISSVEKNIPKRIRPMKNKVKIFMSYTTFDLADDANRATQQNGTLLTTKEAVKSSKGYELVPMNSVSDNEIFATIAGNGKDSNLVRGVWFNGDENNFKFYREQPMDETWLIGLKFSIGFQYRAGKDIVLYVGS